MQMMSMQVRLELIKEALIHSRQDAILYGVLLGFILISSLSALALLIASRIVKEE